MDFLLMFLVIIVIGEIIIAIKETKEESVNGKNRNKEINQNTDTIIKPDIETTEKSKGVNNKKELH